MTRNKRQKNKITLKSSNVDQKEIQKSKDDKTEPVKTWNGRECNLSSTTKQIQNDIQWKPYHERFTIKNRLPLDDIKRLLASVDDFEEKQKLNESRTKNRRSSLTKSDNGVIDNTELNSSTLNPNVVSSRTTKKTTRRSPRNQNLTSLIMESSEKSLNRNFTQKPENEPYLNKKVKKRSSYLLVSVEKLNIDNKKVSEYEKTIDVNSNDKK